MSGIYSRVFLIKSLRCKSTPLATHEEAPLRAGAFPAYVLDQCRHLKCL